MISYSIYKYIHLVSLIVFFTSMTVQFFSEPKKIFKIMSGVSTLLILVSGMGLLARVGVTHNEPWPVWAIIKMIIWFLLGIGLPVIVKRMPHYRAQSYWAMLGLFGLAAWVIIFLR